MSSSLPYLAHQGSYRHWTDGVRVGEKPVSDLPNTCPGGAMMMCSLYRIAGSVCGIQRGKLIVHSPFP